MSRVIPAFSVLEVGESRPPQGRSSQCRYFSHEQRRDGPGARPVLREETRRSEPRPELPEPPQPDPGVEGNRRLTSVNGMVLLVLLAVEGYTLPQVRHVLSLHVFIGLLLVGPVLLKTASTMYRFARYYRGEGAYR